MNQRSAKDIVDEMFTRQQAGDDTVLDDLVARDMVNHAAGPQGRDGLKGILRTIDADLGPIIVDQHHLNRRRRSRRTTPHSSRNPPGLFDAFASRSASVRSSD